MSSISSPPANLNPTPAHDSESVLPLTEHGLARLNSVLSVYNTASPYLQLASRSSFSSISTTHNTLSRQASQKNNSRSRSRHARNQSHTSDTPRLNSLTFEDQRHPGKPGTSLGRVLETLENSDDEDDARSQNSVSDEEESTGKRDSLVSMLNTHISVKTKSSTMTGITLTSSEKGIEFIEKLRKEKDELERREEEQNNYPKGWAVPLLITGICLSIFLISLDRTIITTAMPQITAEFSSYDDLGWYGSAYLLTACAFQPLFGRIYQLFNIKISFLSALVIFLLGSLICAVAPNSITLIFGRAIAGLGSAGVLTGSFVVVSHAVPLQKRPIYTAAVGMMFGVGAVTGPLFGGVFTDLVSWRWCFYFDLPVGCITLLAMLFLFNPTSGPASHRSIIARVSELDLIGNVILLGASIMLFLALQYAEGSYAWSSPLVTGLLSGSLTTFVIFLAWQWWKAEWALIPPRIIRQRSVAASCAVAFFIYGALLMHSYFLPIYFQAIRGASAIASGVDMIAYMLPNALFSLIAGVVVSKNGYFTPPAILGCAIATVGCGLVSTLSLKTATVTWIGFEILVSAGMGMAIQQGFTAVNAALPLDEVPIGTAAVVAFQSLGGSIFLSVGNTILQTRLLAGTKDGAIPGVDGQAIIDAGMASFRNTVPGAAVPALLEMYNEALRRVFVAAVPLAGLALVAACFLEWRSVKSQPQGSEDDWS